MQINDAPADLRNTISAPFFLQSAKRETHIDFKEEIKKFPYDLVLWLKFHDGRTHQIKNRSFEATLSQMYFKKMPVKASLKTVWNRYHELLATKYAGNWQIARIYKSDSKSVEDFVVEYKPDGTHSYHDNQGNPIEKLRFDFDSEKIKYHESKLNTQMELFLIQIKNEHTPETSHR